MDNAMIKFKWKEYRTPPVHCIQTGNCVSRGHEPLKLSRRLTKSKLITVNIEGWHDPYPMNGHQSVASGIDMFEINIYEVTLSTPPTLMRDTKTVFYHKCSKSLLIVLSFHTVYRFLRSYY
jgi:hypothetical protein